MTMRCPLPVIGTVHTARTAIGATPVQAALNRAEPGTLEIDPQFVEGLAGLEGFDYIWLITWLHEPDGSGAEPPALTQVPFLLRPEGRPMGVFATRGPRRINPIGLSLVRVLSIDGGTIRFAGVDLLDGTPVIDVKPYVTRFDRAPGDPRCGWFDTVTMVEGITPSDLDP